jgi:hypothetical protein
MGDAAKQLLGSLDDLPCLILKEISSLKDL